MMATMPEAKIMLNIECPSCDATRARIEVLEKVLEKHRRFHGKVACGGYPECYVCAVEEAALDALKEG